jgi:nucleosome binding factor SPN SPT16 subunit
MSDGVKIDSETMFKRLEHLQSQWVSHKASDWGGADAICIPMGTSTQDQVNYSKSSAIHLYLLGYEFPDTIMILLRNKFLVMAHPKKCGYIEQAAAERANGSISVEVFHKSKDEALNKENFGRLISAVMANGVKLGTLVKGDFAGTFIPSWIEAAAAGGLESVDCALPIGKLLCVKDETEVELCKRAAVLSNKVMKHGLQTEMEEIIGRLYHHRFILLLTPFLQTSLS